MGWCSATEIFDNVVSALVDDTAVPKEKVIERLITALEDGDWDCQSDSAYYDHPIVNGIFRRIHPNWFEEDDDE